MAIRRLPSPTTLSMRGIEVWRDVVGFEGTYEVSNLGRVRSVDRWVRTNGVTCDWRRLKGRYLKASPDHYGYPRVSFRQDGKIRYFKVMHLVYKAFKGEYNERLLRHLDDNKTNSALYNLRPGSHNENLADSYRNGIRR